MKKLSLIAFFISSLAWATYSPNTIITDPTTPANQANVKAANTPATASDQGVVVHINPGTQLPLAAKSVSNTTTAFSSSTGVVNTDMLTGTVNGWFDAGSFNQLSTDIYTTTTVTNGVITFEQTDDTTNASAGIALNLQDQTVLTQTNVTTLTLAASTVKHYQAPVLKRYVRFRLSTAFAGTGTVGATVVWRQAPYTPIVSSIAQATAGSLNSTATVSSGTITTVSSVTSDQIASPKLITDVASAAITTTTTTAALTPTFGASYVVEIPVTSVTGTGTLTVAVQESKDSGTNWYTTYTFPAITAIGFYYSPVLPLKGTEVRYVQTLSGITSITRAIDRNQISGFAPMPVNNNASSNSTGISTTAQIILAPQDSVGFILQNLSTNTGNIRYILGGTATALQGIELLPGQDSGFVPAGSSISIIAESGTQSYNIQWVQQ